MATSQDSQPFRWHYDNLDDHNFEIRGHTLFFVIVIFSVVLLITLLFLYARWICRSPAPPLAAASAHRQPSAGSHRGLDPDAIGNIPIVLHPPSGAPINEVECCICLGIFFEGEKLKVLPNCRHYYHSECVDKWLTTQSSCPLCRAPLRAAAAAAEADSLV